MKIAILSITNQGQKISNELYEKLKDDPLIIYIQQFHKNIKENIKTVFYEYDCIIAIMASGIIIRSIASHIKSKLSDPAVLVIGDDGNYIISLLSGHFGQANNLTLKISKIIDAKPVITTSTDINNKFGIDSLAKKYFCTLKNSKNIQFINKALINNEKVILKIPLNHAYLLDDTEINKSYTFKLYSKEENIIIAIYKNFTVELTPQKLVMGIGARKNIKTELVNNAIKKACTVLNIPIQRITLFSTAEIKKDETGILNNVNYYNKSLDIISMEQIVSYKNNYLSHSDFVMKKFGVKGVCEPCALISAGLNSKLLFKKTAYSGVTIAVAIN